MRLPDFYIIGAMKASTSTLHDQLAAQSGLWMSDPKELYFFSDDPVYARGLDWYASHFADAAPTDLCGESTTHYAKLPTYPKTIERIAAATPDASFIYVMRHPIDRLVSQYTHMWLEREVTVSFSDAVDGAVPELVDYSRYTTQLTPFFEQFGQDRVLPVFFDRMHAQPDLELERVCSFLRYTGTPSWQHDLGANNVSSERLQSSATRDRLKDIPGYQQMRALIPEQAIERVRDRWRPKERPSLSEAQLQRLTSIFDADLAVLGEWVGADLNCENFKTVSAAIALEWAR